MNTINTASGENALTVSQLTGLIKTMLEGSFSSVSLIGEISNFRPNPSGHLYFTLKDANSQISAVMFKGKAMGLDFIPKDGMAVQVQGSISVYAPRGNYQILINKMTKAGSGNIMEMIEERKKRLNEEGLFDASRKQLLPQFPKTIGVVTSPTGAAIRDILNITKTRNPKMSVTVLPAIVQGEDAPESIIRMIKIANKYNLCDVLIVGRGGGSLEDLLPFSDEGVVRAIADSKIPTISAVGHDIDWALSDFAADLRASTPSHAAEMAVPLLADVSENILSLRSDLYESIEAKINNLKLMLKTFTPEGMEMRFQNIHQPLIQRLDFAKQGLLDGINKLIEDKKHLIQNQMQILENCNPQTVFNRGYSMVQDENGNIVRDATSLEAGSKILIRPSVGEIKAQVLETKGRI